MSQFRNLVFEGGGVKGIAYSGALAELESRGITPDIKRVGGTSAGAIMAALIASGADSSTTAAILGGTSFRKFMDDSFGVVRDCDRLLHDYGWYAGDTFAAWIQKQLYALLGRPSLTFAQLKGFSDAEPARFKELYIVGTNLSSGIPMVYSAETTPDEPIWRAVRISMSIPLFFACVRDSASRDVLVDGGVTWNYPLDLFDERKYLLRPAAGRAVSYPTNYGPQHVYNMETLGLRVDTKDEIRAEKEGWTAAPTKIDDFFDYLKCMIGFMTDVANKSHLHTNDWHRTVFLDATGVRATDFDLSAEKVQQLIENGKAGVKAYFDWWEKPESNPFNRLSVSPA